MVQWSWREVGKGSVSNGVARMRQWCNELFSQTFCDPPIRTGEGATWDPGLSWSIGLVEWMLMCWCVLMHSDSCQSNTNQGIINWSFVVPCSCLFPAHVDSIVVIAVFVGFVFGLATHSLFFLVIRCHHTPTLATFIVTLNNGTKLSITRSQYAITGAYALTDIKSPGIVATIHL